MCSYPLHNCDEMFFFNFGAIELQKKEQRLRRKNVEQIRNPAVTCYDAFHTHKKCTILVKKNGINHVLIHPLLITKLALIE